MRFPNPALTLALLASCLLLLSPCSIVHASQGAAPYDLWYGVFFSKMKIGHARFSSKPVTYQGKPASRLDSEVDTELTVLGAKIEQQETSTTFADPVTEAPLWEDFKMASGGETTEVTARFFANHIDARLIAKGGATEKRIPIPAGTKLATDDDTSGFDNTNTLKVGMSETETVFNPLTLALEQVGAKVEQADVPIFDPLSQSAKSTWRVLVTSPEGDQTLFQDPDGNPVRVDMPAGLTMLRESQAVALSDSDPNGAEAMAAAPGRATTDDANAPLSPPDSTAGGHGQYTPPTDFAVATAVNPGGEAIEDPRACRYLSIQVTEPGKAPEVFDIHSVSPPADPTMTVRDAAKRPDLAPYLSDAPYLSLDSPEIEKRAQEIRGSRTNLYDITVQIHDWVQKSMTPDGTLGLPRTAGAICADPRGVCRDYATLYTALARSAGVPTRLCAGIVAFRGRFYYHAWAESYVGGDIGWLPVDPTLPGMFVDATHVPLVKGDPTAMYTLGGVIGEIKAQVLAAS